MAITLLGLGILLPWYTGFIWLYTLGRRSASRQAPHDLLRQIGYGYFIGCSALQGLVHLASTMQPELSTTTISLGLLALSLMGTAVALLQPKLQPGQPSAPRHQPTSRTYRVACTSLLILTALHLLPLLLENQYRPIYPWDAWQTWMYRAKAWYLSGQLVPMAPPNAWLETGVITYNMPGHSYPTLASVIALWAALCAGSWSETLVNLPVFCAALATLAGLYSQTRYSGYHVLGALASIYLLVSIPLWGTHVALAGQADIWMAGYTGLGFVALLRGLSDRHTPSIWLGLLMCALALGVKNEGAVWLLGAMALTFAGCFWRTAMAGAGIGAALVLVLWTFQMHGTVPSIGTFGFDGELLYLPILGDIPIQQFNVWDDYIQAFFLQGSWNILWVLVTVAAVSLLIGPRDSSWHAVLGFFALLFVSQAVIFGFTEHGRWAEDGTAINRLPLHFAPALVYALLLCIRRLTGDKLASDLDPRSTVIAAVGATVLSAAALFGYLSWAYPSSQAQSLDLSSRIGAVVGTATRNNGTVTVSNYQEGITILSSGPIAIDSAKLRTLRLHTIGTSSVPAGFFWRGLGDLNEVNTVTIGYPGAHTIDLSAEPGWSGTITEVGVVFYDDLRAGSAGLKHLELSPRSPLNALRLVWSQWTALELWNQASAHWLAGGARNQSLPLPLLMGGWLLLTLLFCIRGRTEQRTTQALIFALVAWMLVDTRWLMANIRQTARTIDYYTNSNALSALDIDIDLQLGQVTTAAKAALQRDIGQPLILTGVERNQHFKVMRGKYWMLPHPTATFERPTEQLPSSDGNQVLYFEAFKLEPGELRKNTDEVLEALGDSFQSGWEAQSITDSEAFIVKQRETGE